MIIVIVLDNNIINYCDEFDYDNNDDIHDVYWRMLKWLAKQINRALDIFKDFIPAKAAVQGEPHVTWIIPPQNMHFRDNIQREIFADALNQVAQSEPNMSALPLRQIWTYDDMNLYLRDQQRYTASGTFKYWMAIDRTVRYCHTIFFKSPNQAANNSATKRKNGGKNQNDRAKRPKVDRDRQAFKNRKLPTPPKRR